MTDLGLGFGHALAVLGVDVAVDVRGSGSPDRKGHLHHGSTQGYNVNRATLDRVPSPNYYTRQQVVLQRSREDGNDRRTWLSYVSKAKGRQVTLFS